MRLWDLNNNQLLKTYSYSGWVYDVVFSKEGNLLAFSGDGDCSVKLIDISNLKNDYIICSLKGHTDVVNKLVFSNDSKYLISGSEDLSIRIWDIIK